MHTRLAMTPIRVLVFLMLAMSLPGFGHAEAIRVGDVEINTDDFSASRGPGERIAKCLACHGNRGGGDIDFGPDAHYGTPAVRGLREDYLRESLLAYQSGARKHQEMSVISFLLDEKTINFMARALAALEVPPAKSAGELAVLAEKDPLFREGQTIALQGSPRKSVPACMACHGPLGEGTAVGPRLAGQNVLYIENQFAAFVNGDRNTVQSAAMQPVIAGLSADDISAVAHYYSLLAETGLP